MEFFRKLNNNIVISELVSYLFKSIFTIYLILLLAEQIQPTIISVYLNLNYLFILVVILGMLNLLLVHNNNNNNNKEIQEVDWKSYSLISFFGILSFIFIKLQTREWGDISWNFSFICAVAVSLILLFVLKDKTL